jgi:GxxExxY protein
MALELLFPELSYRIINCAFNVHNELGGGLPEAVYQKALQHEFELQNIEFKEQHFSNVLYKGKKIMRNYSDFLVHEQIIVELKSTYRIIGSDYNQVKKDLISVNKQLGIILHFGRQFLTHKRVLNLY